MRAIAVGVAGVIGALLSGGPASLRADDRPLSPAQITLFESDHLRDIAAPVVLEYAFHHHGGPAGDFDDTVSAQIRTIRDDGRKDVWVEFLTGEHHVNFPPALGFNGNPLLMYFLEHDVVEMRETTGAPAQYFRKRVRDAFVDRAEMHPVDVTLDGRTQPGTEIVLAPFRDDGNLARFPTVADKTYRFILCDAVPGRLYRISTTVPAAGSAPGAFEEAMTFREARHETR